MEVTQPPGVKQSANISFQVLSPVPIGGKIKIALPDDGWQMAATPSVFFDAPAGITGTSAWSLCCEWLRRQDMQFDSSSVNVTLTGVNTPPAAQVAGKAALRTVDRNGALIDGPTDVDTDAITAGSLSGALRFNTTNDFVGVNTAAIVSFTTGGRVPDGGKIKLVFPDDDWAVHTANPVVAFDTPSTMTGTASWDSSARTVDVTTTNGTEIPPATAVVLKLHNVTTPATVMPASTSGEIRTLTSRNGLIDGPQPLTTDKMVTGLLSGLLLWDSRVDAPPGVASDVTVTFTTSGAIASGGSIHVVLPADGWTVNNTALAVVFREPSGASGTATWDIATRTLKVVTSGGAAAKIGSQSEVQLVQHSYW
eukprot:g110.t1